MNTKEVVVSFILMVMCGMSQILMISFEMAEMSYCGFTDYWKDGWNYIDSSQPIFFTI